MRDVLGQECWGNPQEAIATSLTKSDRVAAKTGHGVGKTWLASSLVLWFNQTRPFSKVVTTAPKWDQIEKGIWQEIGQRWGESRAKLIGRLNQTEVLVAPNWLAYGQNTDDPIKFQGVHAVGGVLLVVDEASGVLEAIYQAASGFMTQSGCKTFLIGNPNVRFGKFFRCFQPGSGWALHTISSDSAPEFTPSGKPLVSRAWIDEMRRECAPVPERHPVYQVRVMGEFPDADEAGLYPLSLLERSAQCTPTATGRHMGVDVARFGGDRSVAVLLVDNRVAGLHAWEKTDLMRSATIVYQLAEKWRVPLRAHAVHVDVVGLGAGLVDRLTQLGVLVDPVDFGWKAPEGRMRGDWSQYLGRDVKFKNLRAELHWSARRLLDEGQLVITENYSPIWTDMQGIPYRYTPGGELEIWPKDKIREMLGRSPDYSDALMVALSRPHRVQYKVTSIRRRAR